MQLQEVAPKNIYFLCLFVRNPAQPQTPGNWMDLNSLTKAHSASNNREGRLNTECEINNRSAANLHSLNIPSVIGQPSHSPAQIYIFKP